jgi:hypothetical protein
MKRGILPTIVFGAISCALLMGITGCSSPPPAAPSPKIQQEKDVVLVSSTNEDHQHSLTIIWKDIADANRNVTYTTTASGSPSHTHKVGITIQNLKDIKAGNPLTITSNPPIPTAVGIVSNHVHKFGINK